MMFHNNKELRISLVLLGLATAILTLIGLSLSVTSGILILISGLVAKIGRATRLNSSHVF